MTDQNEMTVVLKKDTIEKATSLKTALKHKTENAVINESLDITQQVVRVISEGGRVVLTEKNGKSNQFVMKI
ncbi:MAG: hypothetical protein F4W92_03955 [Gammaproteobacteria bacterium]|nr:hypothetical protein [Gammaproteobacteria bacterium]